MIFNDRFDAGLKLASELEKYREDSQSVIMAIPRGGVETAFYVCRELKLPMEVTIVKKIGAPFNPELAIGAVGEDNTVFLNDDVIKSCGISDEYIKGEIEKKKNEIEKRLEIYRQGESLVDLKNKKVIIIDDGIATGATIKVAIEMVRKNKARKIILAVPVAPREAIEEMEKICEETICLLIPDFFGAVGAFYRDFKQVSDDETVNFINEAKKEL